MEESLKAWIELACRDILNIKDADCNLFEDNLFMVGKHVLQSPNSTFEELHQQGAQTLNLREDDTSLLATATIILKYAVSSECEQKSEYVSHIISMDSDIQEHLMQAIQDQSLVLSEDDQVDESFDDDASVQEDDDTLQSEPFHSPQRSQKSCTDSSNNDTCDHCHKMEKEVQNYTKQISDLLKREKDLEERLKEENTTFLNKNMDMQDMIRAKETLLQEKTLQLQEYEEKECQLLTQVEHFDLLTERVATLQDEVDVLQPLVKRAESAETQLSRMHDKLDKLDGVKDQLKAEVDSHNATQVELLELRVEVDLLRKAKVQVVEYRDRCAENAISIADLTSQLQSAKEEAHELSLKLDQVSEGHHITESYSKSLVDELKVASEALRNSEREGGIGNIARFFTSAVTITLSVCFLSIDTSFMFESYLQYFLYCRWWHQ
jgi:chromosome segregation ATPase